MAGRLRRFVAFRRCGFDGIRRPKREARATKRYLDSANLPSDSSDSDGGVAFASLFFVRLLGGRLIPRCTLADNECDQPPARGRGAVVLSGRERWHGPNGPVQPAPASQRTQLVAGDDADYDFVPAKRTSDDFPLARRRRGASGDVADNDDVVDSAPQRRGRGRERGGALAADDRHHPARTQEPGPAAAPSDPAATVDEDVLRDAFLARRATKSCACALLKPLKVQQLRNLCNREDVTVDTTYVDSETGKLKLLPKLLLLLEMCPVCDTVENVKEATANATDEGIDGKYWNPQMDPDALSVCDAFHLVLLHVITGLPDRSPIRYDLNRFRAHLLQHLVTNWTYHVTKGRQNRLNGNGSVGVRVLRQCVFLCLFFGFGWFF